MTTSSSLSRTPDAPVEDPRSALRRARDHATIAALRVLPKDLMSRGAGLLASTPIPRPLRTLVLRAFGSFYGVNFDEVKEPLASFPSVQSFFVRELKSGARPIDGDASAFVSPCDGAWGASGTVVDGCALQLKGKRYPVAALLGGDAALAQRCDGGAFATLYLAPRDYHRFHAPVAGGVTHASALPGKLWPVNSAGIHAIDGLFAQNERVVAVLRPDARKDAVLAMVAVGATMVGKIKVAFDDALGTRTGAMTSRAYDPPLPLLRGAEWGRFQFGSTIVLVASPGWLELDVQPPGTKLFMGSRIGRVLSA